MIAQLIFPSTPKEWLRILKNAALTIAMLAIIVVAFFTGAYLTPKQMLTVTEKETVCITKTQLTTTSITTTETITQLTTKTVTKSIVVPHTYTLTATATTYRNITITKTTTTTLPPETLTATATVTTTKTVPVTETVTVYVTATTTTIVESNAQLLSNEDEEYLTTVLGLISQAREEIDIFMFAMKYDPNEYSDPANELIRALGDAVDRGVTVRVVVDEVTVEQYPQTITKLKALGIEVREAPDTSTLHAKAVMIDGKYVVVGSHNWTESGLKYNTELSLLVSDNEDVVTEFENLFLKVWNSSTPL